MIIFVRPDWNYDSYTDFWSLVKLSGYSIIRYDEIDIHSNDTYIVSPANGQLREYVDGIGTSWKHRTSELYLWNLERPINGIVNYKRDNDELVEQCYVDKIIVSDVALMSECGVNFIYVPVGSHEDLGFPGTYEEKLYDLIHLSCYSNHRSWMFHRPDLPKSDLCGLSVAPNGWGQERHERLMKSRFMLCTHQDEFPFIEPLRYALAAAYGLPIIAEASLSTSPYDRVYMFDGTSFCNVARSVVNNYDKIRSVGADNRMIMTGALSFRQCIERFI